MTDLTQVRRRAESVLRRTAYCDQRGTWPSQYKWVLQSDKSKDDDVEVSDSVIIFVFASIILGLFVACFWYFGLSWYTAPMLFVAGWMARSLSEYEDNGTS